MLSHLSVSRHVYFCEQMGSWLANGFYCTYDIYFDECGSQRSEGRLRYLSSTLAIHAGEEQVLVYTAI